VLEQISSSSSKPTVEAEITTEGLKIEGTLVQPIPSELHRVLGTDYRDIEIPLHGGEVRRIRIFDDVGFAYYLDETPPIVSSVLFVLFPQGAPFGVGHAFDGRLRVNDTPLTSDMSAARLPTAGSLQFKEQFGHKWRAATPTFSVWFSLRRRQNRTGKRAGTPKLTDVSICYDNLTGA
jgi:hypothetical protein